MSQTSIFAILVMAMLAVQIASAELLTLHNHVIDTGYYSVLLPDVQIGKPYSFLSTNYSVTEENISLNSGIGTKGTFIIICDLKNFDGSIPNDLENYMNQFVKNEHAQNSTKVSKPYPGWIVTSSNDPMIYYIEQINSSEYMILATDETPEMATLILKNLKVYPITDKDELTRQKVAEALQ